MHIYSKETGIIWAVLASMALAACSGGGSTPTPPPPPPAPPPPPPPPPPSGSVDISGVVTFDDVPLNQATNGLNYNAITQRPARGVVVEAVDSGGGILDSAVTDASGAYEVTVDSNTNVRIRASARMTASGGMNWDVTVRDNTSSNSIYVLAGGLSSSGTTDSTRNLNAASGWGGTSYTGTRAAAPFAILDAVYDSLVAVNNAAPGTNFPTAQVFWSVNNTSASGDVSNGEIGSSSYTRIGGIPTILILGDENSDTDEYDSHVVSHEVGHYLEDQLSRSDSIGGSHSLNDRLDPRVAVAEGWGNAFSAIALGDTIYRDSSGAQQAVGFSFNIESNSASPAGWYNEASVQSILYDIFDSADDGADTISAGFAPIVSALTSTAYTNEENPTTIFSLINAIRMQSGVDGSGVDSLLTAQSINGTGSDGAGETNSGGISNALPVLKTVSVGGGPINVCSVDDEGTFNNLGNRELIRLSIATSGSYTLTMTRTSGPSGRDPDFLIFRRGDFIAAAESGAADTETLTRTLAADEYFIDAYDFLNIDDAGPSGDVCFSFTVV